MHGPDTPGHFGNLRCRREAFGVTGAMLFVRKALYEQLGGFDEKLPLNYNDVDFCLRLRREGYSCVVDPNVRVYHFESASKVGTFRAEKEALFSRWPGLLDPYFNAGFVQRDPAYVVASSRETANFSDATTFERWLDLRIGVRTSRKRLTASPLISVGVSVYNQPVSMLREMMASFTFQTYPGRELVILDNGSSNPATLAWLASVAATPKVRVLRLEENAGIAGGQRALVRAAKGDWFVPIDSDDFLTIDALRIFAERMQENPQARIFYSDEFKSDPASNKFAPFFKPDFDAVSISNCCYPGHLMAMKMDLLREIDADGDDRATWCHDWDTTFRSLAAGETPVHVPEQLYAWRINPGSTASAETGAKPEAVASQVFVLERALADRGVQDKIRVQPNVVGPNTGMWTLDALTNVDASILDATALWLKSDRPEALLRDAAQAQEWVAILLAPGAEAKITDLLALSAVAHWDPRVGVVSGALSQNDGKSVLWSGGVFTAQGVSELSYGQNWADGGYYGRLYLQRCVDVAAPLNVLIKSTRLVAALDVLKSEGASFSASNLMVALGVLAAREDWLIAITPVLRPTLPHDLRSILPMDRDGLLRQLADFTPTSRWYGAHLSAETPFVPSDC
jgi:GT2 family glycosyltransferase